jgi:enoyl-CoA hydratase
MGMGGLVGYERSDAVSVLTMDDGKVNVMSSAMLGALNAALDRAQADGTVVLIAGRENVFSAGFDLAVFKQDKAAQVAMLSAGARITERLLSFPAPVVAAVGGHAIAMGAFLALSADLRIGVLNGAGKMAANEVQIGMTVPRFATEVCRQRLAPAHFNRVLITAEPYDPQRAVEAGFLDELAPAGQLLQTARAKAAALAKLVRENHVATKLRARGDALQALRRAIEADIADWNARTG